MIQTIEISTMEDLFRMISDQEYREDLGRHRNLFVYRGEPDASLTSQNMPSWRNPPSRNPSGTR